MLRATLLTLALTSMASAAVADNPATRRGPGIRIWTSSGDLYQRNERVRVYFRTERDAFVTILRVDTDGRVRVLFPRHPRDDGYANAGVTHSVSNYDRGTAFVVDDYPGVGYIFGIASYEPFEYRSIHDGDRWDLRAISDGRIHGDPRSSLEELMMDLLPRDYEDFDTHIQQYYVERRFDYPRFVCYDCHTYTPYVSWNPYHSWCRSYTLVVWNDPWYYYPSYWYPTRYYGGRRVVYSYPRTASRYVFKERDDRSPGVDYRRRDQAGPSSAGGGGRRIDERGVRAVDIGGVGRVPAPRTVSDRRIASDRPEPREEPRDPREPREGTIDGGRRTSGAGGDVSRPESRGNEGRSGDPQQPRRVEIVPNERDRRAPESAPSRDRQEPSRPEARPEPREAREPSARPESREPAARPDTREPAARPDRSQPERSQPQARPAAPETRSRPEASRPSSPPSSSRPEPRAQPAPREGSSGRDGGLTRRRP